MESDRKGMVGLNPTFPTKQDKFVKRKILVTRDAAPAVTAMIDDAYQIVSMQLSRFRGKAGIQEFDVKDMTALHKLICSLKILEDSEKNRVREFELNGLSQEQIDALAEEATEYGDHKS